MLNIEKYNEWYAYFLGRGFSPAAADEMAFLKAFAFK
jgi:hypothetical protein